MDAELPKTNFPGAEEPGGLMSKNVCPSFPSVSPCSLALPAPPKPAVDLPPEAEEVMAPTPEVTVRFCETVLELPNIAAVAVGGATKPLPEPNVGDFPPPKTDDPPPEDFPKPKPDEGAASVEATSTSDSSIDSLPDSFFSLSIAESLTAASSSVFSIVLAAAAAVPSAVDPANLASAGLSDSEVLATLFFGGALGAVSPSALLEASVSSSTFFFLLIIFSRSSAAAAAAAAEAADLPSAPFLEDPWSILASDDTAAAAADALDLDVICFAIVGVGDAVLAAG
mmetsp:Transcript_36717/g.80367  ORF Transcript_36717/g.80367 Transcript_36717/m.80367 type:complete len:283 (+) Transcript_36717:900-1748(+)